MSKKWLRIEEDNLKCAICQQLGLEKDPRLLSCGDTFCSSCLQNFANSNESNNFFTCPKCKEEIKWPENGVDGIPKNVLFKYFEEVDSRTDWSEFKNENNMIKFWDESEFNIIKEIKSGIEDLSDNIHEKEQELIQSARETYKLFKKKWRENQAYLHSLTLTPRELQGNGEKLFEEVLFSNYKLEHTEIKFSYELNLVPEFYLLRSMKEEKPITIASSFHDKRVTEDINSIIYEDSLIYEKVRNELYQYLTLDPNENVSKLSLKSPNSLFTVFKGVVYHIYWKDNGKFTMTRKESGSENNRLQTPLAILTSVAQDASQFLNRKSSKKDGVTISINDHQHTFDKILIEKYERKEWKKIGEIQQEKPNVNHNSNFSQKKYPLFAVGDNVFVLIESGKVYCYPFDAKKDYKKWEIIIKQAYDTVNFIQIIDDTIYLILEKGEENLKDIFLLKYSTSGSLLRMQKLEFTNVTYKNCFILPSENILVLKEKTLKIISPFGRELDEKTLENLTGDYNDPIWLKIVWKLKEIILYGIFKKDETNFIGFLKLSI